MIAGDTVGDPCFHFRQFARESDEHFMLIFALVLGRFDNLGDRGKGLFAFALGRRCTAIHGLNGLFEQEFGFVGNNPGSRARPVFAHIVVAIANMGAPIVACVRMICGKTIGPRRARLVRFRCALFGVTADTRAQALELRLDGVDAILSVDVVHIEPKFRSMFGDDAV